MIPFIPVQGTDTWHVDDPDPRQPYNWWRSGSLLLTELAVHGLQPLNAADPFIWSTDLDGAKFWERWPPFKSRKDKRDWLAGGNALRWYATYYHDRREPLTVISHSHGAQVVHYAAAGGLRIDYWLDIAGPVRSDVLQETAAGLDNIGHWLHVTDGAFDLIQALGDLGDGHLGHVPRPSRVTTLSLSGISHSELLSSPLFIPRAWRERGLIQFLLGAEVAHVV
jgi:hypothetical protein